MSNKKDDQARQRAEMILRVRSGAITASEAARLLGTSRKTYYQWEKRGLEGMLGGLTQGRPGRPLTPRADPEVETLRRRVADLENQLKVMTEIHKLKELLHDSPDPPRNPPSRPAKRRKKKR